MLRFLRRLFVESHPLDTDNLGEKVRDVSFRVLRDEDIPVCLSLYQANEAAHFPSGRFAYYSDRLSRRQFLTLIASRDGEDVGCCGLQYDGEIAVLCFGMVEPAHHRRGIGTAQLLVRIALLTAVDDLATVALYAVPNSLPFYRRFGFDFTCEAPADDGGTYPLGVLRLSRSFIEQARRVLEARNITYPDVRHMIPKREPSSQEKS